MVRRSLQLVALLFIALGVGLPSPAWSQPASRGAALYRQHCAGCHAANPRFDPHSPYGVNLGAGNPAMITSSLSIPAMAPLLNLLELPRDASDLSVYLSTAFAPTPAALPGRLALPATQSFGDTPLQTTSAPLLFSIGNTGGASVGVRGVFSSNAAEFAVVSENCTSASLPAGGSCRVSVAFTPAAPGMRSASITIVNSSADGTPSFVVRGDGIGLAPALETRDVIEYFHAGFGHHFITMNPAEIAALDQGTLTGWARSGHSFKVYAKPGVGTEAACRFFTVAFPPASSHFYTSESAECAALKASPDWIYEDQVFHTLLPAADGSCAEGTVPVLRLYNNGRTGAPNHRYTTASEVRARMLDEGYAPEGPGPGVSWCVPQ